MRERTGERIGRHVITGELGRGAMGIVYRATDPAIGRAVAIKTIRLSDLTDPAERERLRERLRREARSAGVLSHPNIVTVFDVGEEGDEAYICMELVEGPTLERRAREDALAPDALLAVLRQVADALDYAHSKGVVHRDVKPANVMLHDGHIAKVTDFGVARIESLQMTQAGLLLGTPNYMAPEQIEGRAVTGQADQFSLGVMAYELLTGEKPFAAESLPTLLFRIAREAPTPAQRINPTLGGAIDHALERALAKEPGARYRSCREFVTALEAACSSLPGWMPLAMGGAQAMATVMADRDADGTNETAVTTAPMPEAPTVMTANPVATLPPLASTEEPAPPMRRGWAWGVGLLAVATAAGAVWQWSGSQAEPQSATPTAAQRVPSPEPPSLPVSPKDAPVVVGPDSPGVPARPRPAGRNESTLEVVTEPAGATAVIDYDRASACKTPCTRSLPVGQHTLQVTLPGYRSVSRTVLLPQGAAQVVSLERLTGRLYFQSEPTGAAVLINGQERPERTPFSVTLPVGEYQVEVRKDGFTPDSQRVTVAPGGLQQVLVRFGEGR